MLGYTEIETQAELDALLDRTAGFHDSMIGELHLVNRAFIGSDHSMCINHRLDAQLLVQTGGLLSRSNLLFTRIQEIRTDGASEFRGAIGSIEEASAPTETRRLSLTFDRTFVVAAERLFVRDRSDWLGPKPRLGPEVPEPNSVPATAIGDDWRQCSACSDGFKADLGDIHVMWSNDGTLRTNA